MYPKILGDGGDCVPVDRARQTNPANARPVRVRLRAADSPLLSRPPAGPSRPPIATARASLDCRQPVSQASSSLSMQLSGRALALQCAAIGWRRSEASDARYPHLEL